MPVNLTPEQRDQIFGPLVVTGHFGRDGVTFENDPPIVEVPFGPFQVKIHQLAAPSLQAIARDLEAAGLMSKIHEIYGFNPRRVRTPNGGNTDKLSAHAYGSAVDVNYSDLPQGEHTNALQAELAPFFEEHGWFWGERFETPDPHHFSFQGDDPLLTESQPVAEPIESPAPAESPPKPKTKKRATITPLFFWLGEPSLSLEVLHCGV